MEVFRECHNLVYIGCEYNQWYGQPHSKSYFHQEFLCASFIRDVRLAPELNPDLNDEIFIYVFQLTKFNSNFVIYLSVYRIAGNFHFPK